MENNEKTEVYLRVLSNAGIPQDKIDKLGTTEYPVEQAVADIEKSRVADYINQNKYDNDPNFQTLLNKYRDKGIKSTIQRVMDLYGTSKEHWAKAGEEAGDNLDARAKRFLELSTEATKKRIEELESMGTSTSKEMRKELETLRQKYDNDIRKLNDELAQKQTKERNYEEVVIPKLKMDYESKLAQKQKSASLFQYFMQANISFKHNSLKVQQDYPTYLRALERDYDVEVAPNGDTKIYKKGSKAEPLHENGRAMKIEEVFNRIAEERGELKVRDDNPYSRPFEHTSNTRGISNKNINPIDAKKIEQLKRKGLI